MWLNHGKSQRAFPHFRHGLLEVAVSILGFSWVVSPTALGGAIKRLFAKSDRQRGWLVTRISLGYLSQLDFKTTVSLPQATKVIAKNNVQKNRSIRVSP